MNAQRILAIVNPHGGKRRGLKILERIAPVFAKAGKELEVRVTEYPGHAGTIAQTFDQEAFEACCIIGGDGTIHEVADGLMHRSEKISIPLGFIPAGSGNTMHQHLQCTDPLEAARRIIAGNLCPLDAARVTMGEQVAYCVDIIGWGAVADINRTAEQLRFLGPSRYAAASLWRILKPKPRRIRLILDGQTFDDEFLFVIGCNTKFTGKGMKLAPRADIGDGKIDVVVLRNASRLQMLKFFTKVFDGSHLSLDYVEYYQVHSFAIESEDRDALDLDGEIKGSSPVRVEMIPAAFQIFA
jgi:YegS/Rv2252/BmrU family lipid kinase